MSNGVASSGTSAGSATKQTTASGSIHRRISQADAARSMWMLALVAHLTTPASPSAERSSREVLLPQPHLRPGPRRRPQSHRAPAAGSSPAVGYGAGPRGVVAASAGGAPPAPSAPP